MVTKQKICYKRKDNKMLTLFPQEAFNNVDTVKDCYKIDEKSATADHTSKISNNYECFPSKSIDIQEINFVCIEILTYISERQKLWSSNTNALKHIFCLFSNILFLLKLYCGTFQIKWVCHLSIDRLFI